MGAWGVMTFEDDSSLDILDEWIDRSATVPRMCQELSLALSQEYFDYNAGQVASVFAAIVEFVLSPTTAPDYEESVEYNEELTSWLSTLNRSELREAIPLAVQGLEKLLSEESELNELWAENSELYTQWLSFNKDRLARLQKIEGGVGV